MQVRYRGMFDSVIAPEVRLGALARGEAVEVDDELGARLLRQAENWEAVKAAPSKRAAESTP